MYYVYVIKNQFGKMYIGQTNCLVARIKAHNENKNFYTRNKGPWELIYSEELCSRAEVMKRERYLKTGVGREWLKNKILT